MMMTNRRGSAGDGGRALGLPRTSWYRRLRPASPLPSPSPVLPDTPFGSHPRALATGERQVVLDISHVPHLVDVAPAQVYATLLDEGVYLASERMTYHIPAQAGETGERRNQSTHSAYRRFELPATCPNLVGSWDIA
ncbi:MAG: hypothetical protein NTZ05_02445 [Chloroflexi bacterium]|nr:hypothetical protein [Chloroflexota bacterium]